LYALDENLESEALNYIKKSYYLNPCERGRHLLKYILFNTLNNSNYANKVDIDNLAILCRFYNIKDEQVTL
jgi:hypothetical protein